MQTCVCRHKLATWYKPVAPETRKIVKKTKLTSKQYYNDSGFTQHRKKVQKWLLQDPEYKRANEELSETQNVIEYLRVLTRYDRVI